LGHVQFAEGKGRDVTENLCRIPLLGIENIRARRKFEFRHVLLVPGGRFDHTRILTLAVDSIGQVLETKPSAVQLLDERPSTRLLCLASFAGSEKPMNT
jgi:hypothetical protein